MWDWEEVGSWLTRTWLEFGAFGRRRGISGLGVGFGGLGLEVYLM